jgi:hypothetical protein
MQLGLIESFSNVMAGLDPAIHLKIEDSIEGDGCPGHLHEDALRALAQGMTTFYEGRHLPIRSNTVW